MSQTPLTVNAYLGLDTLQPFIEAAGESAGGIFVVLRSSNPGAGDLQDLKVSERPVYEHLAHALATKAAALRGGETEWSGLGVVVGATWPEQSRRVREILPRSLFLVPGYGAQGGGAREAVAGFVAGPAGRLEGGLVNSSRGILFPPGSDTDDLASWERAVDEALDRAIGELGEAVSA